MTRILVAYTTRFGQTRKISDRIARHLRDRGFAVELADLSNVHRPPPDEYDLVIQGSRILMGNHSANLVTYVREHLDILRTKQTAFFVVCSAAARPDAGEDPSGYAHQLFDLVDWHPAVYTAFAGALQYRSYGWLRRLAMRRIARHAGLPTDTSRDHELTDWIDVERFSGRLAELLETSKVRSARAAS